MKRDAGRKSAGKRAKDSPRKGGLSLSDARKMRESMKAILEWYNDPKATDLSGLIKKHVMPHVG